MASLVSAEGVSQLMARFTGAYMFEYADYKSTWADQTATAYEKG